MREFFTAEFWRAVWFYFWHPDVPAGGYVPSRDRSTKGMAVLDARRPCRYCPDPLCPEDCPECGAPIHDLDAVPPSFAPSAADDPERPCLCGCVKRDHKPRCHGCGSECTYEPEPCRRCEHDEQTRGVVQLSTFELYPPDHAPWCREGRPRNE